MSDLCQGRRCRYRRLLCGWLIAVGSSFGSTPSIMHRRVAATVAATLVMLATTQAALTPQQVWALVSDVIDSFESGDGRLIGTFAALKAFELYIDVIRAGRRAPPAARRDVTTAVTDFIHAGGRFYEH